MVATVTGPRFFSIGFFIFAGCFAFGCSSNPNVGNVADARATDATDALDASTFDAVAPDGSSADGALPLGDASVNDGAVSDSGTPELVCPTVGEALTMGSLQDSRLNEVSGLAPSLRNDGLLWVHNDSGDSARLFLIRPTGETVLEVSLTGVSADDFEAMAIGMLDGAPHVFVGDIGDNDANRSFVSIHDFPEPELGSDSSVSITPRSTRVTYADGAHNAESLLFDPVESSLWIVTKAIPSGRLFEITSGQLGSEVISTSAGTVDVDISTSADASGSGSMIAVRGYFQASLWLRDTGRSIPQAFAEGERCTLPLELELQGETIAFAADDSGYFTISEGRNAPIYFYPFQ